MSKKWSRRNFMKLVGAGSSALVLAACAPATTPVPSSGDEEPEVPAEAPAEEQIELTIWGDFGDSAEAEVIESFNEAYPNITMEALNVESNPEKLITAVTGGNPPDAFSMDRYLSGEWAARGVITALTEYVNNSDEVDADRLYKRLLADVSWRDEIWALPRWTDCRVFWWNKDLFEEKGLDPESPPTTWAELEAMCDQVFERDENDKIKYLGFSPVHGNPPGFLQFWIYLWQLGGQYLSDDHNEAVFNGEEGVGALAWMVDMVDKYGGIDEIAEFMQPPTIGPGQDVFGLGFLAGEVHGQWMVQNYAKYAPDLNYGLASIPLPDGGSPTNYIGGWTLVMPKGVKYPDATWAYMEHTMTDENSLKIALDHGTIPPYQEVAFSDDWIRGDPNNELFANEVIEGRWVPVTPGVAEMFSIQIRLLDEALHHLKTPQEALDEAVEAVDVVLDANKDLRGGS